MTTLYVCVCYRYIGRLGRSMGWSTQRMRYWTDTEGHMGSLGVDPVSGPFQFFSPFSIFLDYMVVINYVVITSYFLNLFPLFFYFLFLGSLSYIFCLIFQNFPNEVQICWKVIWNQVMPRSKNTTSFTTAVGMPSNLEHLIFTLSPLLTPRLLCPQSLQIMSTVVKKSYERCHVHLLFGIGFLYSAFFFLQQY